MSEVNENVGEGQVAAPAKKTVKKAVKAKKPAPKASAKKAAKGKPAKAKKESGPRVSSQEKMDKILKFLSKQKHPVTRNQIKAGTGIQEGINAACASMVDKIKREAAKFHDMGRGYVFTITAKGKAAAAKL